LLIQFNNGALRRLFFVPASALLRNVTQSHQGPVRAVMCSLHRFFPPMQSFAALAILSGAYVVLGWSYITEKLPQDNLKAYEACSKLHPQRYCAINYFPSKLKTMGRN
jgi:hypothetical protein